MFQNVPNSAVVNQVLNEELQMTDVISMLKSMTSVTLSVMYIVCVVVMSLLTVLWLKGHSKMIAIYNTLGQRKFKTIQILLYEILMITVPALVFRVQKAMFRPSAPLRGALSIKRTPAASTSANAFATPSSIANAT